MRDGFCFLDCLFASSCGVSSCVVAVVFCVSSGRFAVNLTGGFPKMLYESPGGNQVDGLPPASSDS